VNHSATEDIAMIPRKYAPVLFGLVLSGVMSLLVSGISTLRATGLAPSFVAAWLSAWLTAWLVAFPVVLVVAPLARRALDRLMTGG
jgi:Na+/H+ antiporter NhaD/arsenite permease-like protein